MTKATTTQTPGPDAARASGSAAAGPVRGDGEVPAGKPCDFCGEHVPRVRRVALDGGYERLRTPHRELYACPACSERKEARRLGLAHR